MKKINQLFKGRVLKATKGTQGRYDYSESTVIGYESGKHFFFKMIIDSKRGNEETVTTDLALLLERMKAYAKTSEWKLVKKS